jgi:hypothetical protein
MGLVMRLKSAGRVMGDAGRVMGDAGRVMGEAGAG